jgi:hypothetical protein
MRTAILAGLGSQSHYGFESHLNPKIAALIMPKIPLEPELGPFDKYITVWYKRNMNLNEIDWGTQAVVRIWKTEDIVGSGLELTLEQIKKQKKN